MPSDSSDETTNNDPTPSSPAGVPATGFCLHIQRIRQEERAGMGFPRTVSEYQCYWNGEAIPDLAGQMVERGGPGDNSSNGVQRHRRIEAGKYPLSIQDGEHYKTYHYVASGFPFPGVLLDDTGHRPAAPDGTAQLREFIDDDRRPAAAAVRVVSPRYAVM